MIVSCKVFALSLSSKQLLPSSHVAEGLRRGKEWAWGERDRSCAQPESHTQVVRMSQGFVSSLPQLQ